MSEIAIMLTFLTGFMCGLTFAVHPLTGAPMRDKVERYRTAHGLMFLTALLWIGTVWANLIVWSGR